MATPHPLHLDTARLCLQQGKAVLCEKPLTANLAQAEALAASARQHGAFLMEAMWTRFNPVMVQVRAGLAEGRIGEPRIVTADFGFAAAVNPRRACSTGRWAGALLDVGVYVVSLAHMVYGSAPTRIRPQRPSARRASTSRRRLAGFCRGRAGIAHLRHSHQHAAPGAYRWHRGAHYHPCVLACH